MGEQVEVGREAVFGPGSRNSGSPGLRLLQPWVADEAVVEREGRTRADGSARMTNIRRRLAPVSLVDQELARPSATVVMRQLLDAWRSAERQLAATVEGSLERPQIQAEVATLRSLYQGLFAQVRLGQAERSQTGG